jgi:hypothetical protein
MDKPMLDLVGKDNSGATQMSGDDLSVLHLN